MNLRRSRETTRLGPLVLSCCLGAVMGACHEPSAPDVPEAAQTVDGPLADVAPERTTSVRCVADLTAPQRTDYARPGPHRVGTLNVTFEDRTRGVAARDKRPAVATRKLVTSIHYPAAAGLRAPLARGEPFPMLMYSHGFSSSKAEAQRVAERAASHGYVVVAPDFPQTNLLAPGGADVNDGANQPKDVSFVLDQVLALTKDPKHVLANAVDEARIGALGVSLGGFTTLVVSFHPTLRDPRIKAAMPIAALSSFFAEGFYHTRALPLLLLHGDIDAFVDYELHARRAFARAAPNARLITVRNGTHAAFAVQFDPALVAVMNAAMGLPDAHPSNPDGFGCGGAAGGLNSEGAGFLAPLGGAENFITYDAVNERLGPCRGKEHTKPAIGAAEQVEISARSAVAFFDAHLGSSAEKRNDGCRYLELELPKLASVRVE
ncbi:MAG: CocE/NonD family hydrolase [Polyangiales bacterium]